MDNMLYTIDMTDIRVSTDADYLDERIVVYAGKCPFCAYWHRLSYSEEIIAIALKEHMVRDHRLDFISRMQKTLDIDQLIIDSVSHMYNATARQAVHWYVSTVSVPVMQWPRLYDIVTITNV